MLSTRIHNLPKKWRDRAHGDAGLIALADELEEHLKDAALCDSLDRPRGSRRSDRAGECFRGDDHKADILHAFNEERGHAKGLHWFRLT
jgi:hypothetical protein